MASHDYNERMDDLSLEQLCELGQEQLMQTHYLDAEATLVKAERLARMRGDWDLLSRLYMPLQEARRQRRQRCGEGIVCLDLLADGPNDHLEARHVIEHYSHGQLLVAGWGTIEPALRVRQMAAEHVRYVETFLAATFPADGQRVAVIVPDEHVVLPEAIPQSLERLREQLPDHCVLLQENELPHGSRRGTYQTYGEVMALWERTHAPFLAAADAEADLHRRIDGYRKTIEVDYACELAHQHLSDCARELARLDASVKLVS
jgi:hypothetical protein